MSSSTYTVRGRWPRARSSGRSSGRGRWPRRPPALTPCTSRCPGCARPRVLLPVPAGRYFSRVGRTRTAPAYDAAVASLAMAFVSCAHYETGLVHRLPPARRGPARPGAAPRRLPVRVQGARPASNTPAPACGPETVTLADYRQRLAQYRTDPDLQAAHAVAPWLVVLDDHEVDNNWADDTPGQRRLGRQFMNRRAAAFKAYYENMPLRGASIPRRPDIRLYRRRRWGRLANFHMLDTRQFRDVQACGDAFQGLRRHRRPDPVVDRPRAGAVARRGLREQLGHLGRHRPAGLLRPP